MDIRDHVPFRAVEHKSGTYAAFAIRVSSANLHYHLGSVVEPVGNQLRVGSLPLVFITKTSTGGIDLGRQSLVQTPPRDIDIVNAVVSQLAVSEVPKPMPVI